MRGSCFASSAPLLLGAASKASLPVVDVVVDGGKARALVDTGCSTTLASSKIVGKCTGESYIMAFDGTCVKCAGSRLINVLVGDRSLRVDAVVVDGIVGDVDVVLGMDVITELGGVTVGSEGVRFGGLSCAVAVASSTRVDEAKACSECPGSVAISRIEDRDFVANFDGTNWSVEWKWKSIAPILTNKIDCYDRCLEGTKKEEFEKEVNKWIEEGILVPWKDNVKEGILALMAVEQPTKNKVRPVLDFREMNESVESHTGDEVTDVCAERLREWRQIEGETAIVDLKSAYLQIRVSEHLWQYQLVRFKGTTYCLTRLGFGLNSAPRIMSKILKTVLAVSPTVKKGTSSYIDDIIVDKSTVSVSEVVQHLSRFGLVTKPPEELDGGTVLGLKIAKDEKANLVFRRGNEIPALPAVVSRRELFSICGKLVGHYPVVGWLRVACSFVKRVAQGSKWADSVGSHATAVIAEILSRVKNEDPVRGRWSVTPSTQGTVWCDASSIAMGVVLEIGEVVVEDASWLRKKDDFNHINVAELEALVKGVNLACKWSLTNINVLTDSATVYGWVNLTLSEDKRVKTKGASEIIVKRRLGVLKNLITELNLVITVGLVPSGTNKSDVLTRVKKSWLVGESRDSDDTCDGERAVCAAALPMKESHDLHHMGVERTLYLARKVDPAATRESAKRVVRQCMQCQSIDPAPVIHQQGSLGVERDWMRAAIDVTHYGNIPYLSFVDCGPGRFAIWRKMTRETAECICAELEKIFLERGPVDEILMDNATAFRSDVFYNFLRKWNIQSFYRAAYRASGNGIVERHHRTIKAVAERGRIDPVEAVFWYNMAPRSGQDENTVPQRAIFKYNWRHPSVVPEQERFGGRSTVQVGEEVWVKPPDARCTSQWKKGIVTGVNSANNVAVDGTPRHILDVRKVILAQDDEAESDGGSLEGEQIDPPRPPESRYPRRERRPPLWMDGYVS